MGDQHLHSKLASRFAHELVTALATAIGTIASVQSSSEPAMGTGYLLSVKVGGAQSGTVVGWVESAVAEAAARAATESEGQPPLDAVIGLLRETATHACAIVALAHEFSALRFNVSAITPGSAPNSASLFRFAMPDGSDGTVGVSASIAEVGDPTVAKMNGNLDLVLDVELPLVVRFGRTTLSLKALSGLGPGSIVDMGRSPDDPVELLVSDKVIAYGEVVIVDGSYGLRITDLVSRSDRIRALETHS
ncbi:MAG: FliM/FliN family flagellar motor switch protein [Vicinamibacterales bacterium]